jgi:hypothetical protein
MPRKKQNVGLEHGGDYGTVQLTADSMNPNMGGIPVANPSISTDVTPSSAPPAPDNAPLPLETATSFTPQITPLLAEGSGRIDKGEPTVISDKQVSGEIVARWANASNSTILATSAAQLLAPQ